MAVETVRLGAAIRHAEQRHARLEDALLKWSQVFQLAGWGAAVVDPTDRRIDTVNPAFARMHGYGKPEELTGRLFDDRLIQPGEFVLGQLNEYGERSYCPNVEGWPREASATGGFGRNGTYLAVRQIEQIHPAHAPVTREVMQHCGHSPHRDQAQATLDRIVKFLARVE